MTNVHRVDFRSYAVRKRQEIIESYAPFGEEFARGLADYEVFVAGGELRQNPYADARAAEWQRGFDCGKHIRLALQGPLTDATPEARAEHGVALTLARYRAKQIVKERWLASGHRLAEVELRDVIGWAEAYIKAHPEMLAEAVETVRQSPAMQKLVRARMRMAKQWRKATTDRDMQNL